MAGSLKAGDILIYILLFPSLLDLISVQIFLLDK
jgi:hypothetical protein